ncbi:hypothetical protein GFS31_21250 [Leptolyngbya sp. BL0902]|nr:hypothetical protein GFS31_21250 [Leptolyngbya sp. BL0902]
MWSQSQWPDYLPSNQDAMLLNVRFENEKRRVAQGQTRLAET